MTPAVVSQSPPPSYKSYGTCPTAISSPLSRATIVDLDPGASRETESMGTRIIYETPDRSMTLATRGSLFVTIHRRNYSAEEFTLLHRHQLSFARAQGEPFPLLTILDVSPMHIVRFSGEAREATVRLAREMTPHVRCSGVVFDREGFAASAIRSLITTVSGVSRQPVPSRVFGDLGATIRWIATQLDRPLPSEFDAAEIVASVRTLRETKLAV